MPTYDYECKSCSHTFEAFQSMKDDLLKECPRCGKELRRLIGGGLGVIFKGSGFYTTDYKKSSSTTGTIKKESKAENTSEKKSEKKTDSGAAKAS